jgi:hypothetical protein
MISVLRAGVASARVDEVDVAGGMVDVNAVGEVEGHAASLRCDHLDLATGWAYPHQPHVHISEVQVAGLGVELQAD